MRRTAAVELPFKIEKDKVHRRGGISGCTREDAQQIPAVKRSAVDEAMGALGHLGDEKDGLS